MNLCSRVLYVTNRDVVNVINDSSFKTLSEKVYIWQRVCCGIWDILLKHVDLTIRCRGHNKGWFYTYRKTALYLHAVCTNRCNLSRFNI